MSMQYLPGLAWLGLAIAMRNAAETVTGESVDFNEEYRSSYFSWVLKSANNYPRRDEEAWIQAQWDEG